ncbi:VWA domain-containing protein [Streptomyces celluloflavus]
MGIRSLLRNAFGRSKATREETGGAPSGADAPESATIPEAREESAPGAVTPEAEVPAARTAPSGSPKPDRAPKTATLPAQGSPVDIGAAKSHLTHSGAGDNSGSGSSSNSSNSLDKADDAKADAVTVPAPAEAPEAVKPVEAVKAVEEPAPAAPEPEVTTTADLVSQAFDNPAPAPVTAPAAPSSEPAAETAKPTATPEAKPETKPEAKPEATTTPETDLKAAAEPVSAPEPIPTAEPKTESKTEPKPEPKTESAAKSAAEPTAEPTAEAAPEPQPAPETDSAPHEDETPAPAAAPSATSSPSPDTSPDASSPLSRLEATAPGLVSLYTSAGATLEKHGLAAQRAIVYLVLDRSGSMRNYYKDGTVQHLAEQALGLSAHLDDGTVPVVFFSTDVDGTADLDLANHQGRIEELHTGLGHMGRTNYHWAITEVVDHYKKSGATAPAFVIFQTDGAPTSKPAAEKALCEAAGLPVFWQFIGFGDPDAKGFDFLRKLDDLTVPDRRAVDNAGFFHAGRDPRSLSADEFYQQLMVEFPEWLTEARTAGVLKDN